jgi:hypothetical protein
MEVVDPGDLLRPRFDVGQVQVDDDGVLPAAHDHARQRLVRARVDLLVRRVGRDVDEIAGPRLRRELEPLAPAHPRAAGEHVDHALQMTVVVRAGLRVRVDEHGARPEALGTGRGGVDRRRAVHPGGLRRVHVQFVGMDDADAGEPPVDSGLLGRHRGPPRSAVPTTGCRGHRARP